MKVTVLRDEETGELIGTRFSLAAGTEVKLGNAIVTVERSATVIIKGKELDYDAAVETIFSSSAKNAAVNSKAVAFTETREEPDAETGELRKVKVETFYNAQAQRRQRRVE